MGKAIEEDREKDSIFIYFLKINSSQIREKNTKMENDRRINLEDQFRRIRTHEVWGIHMQQIYKKSHKKDQKDTEL